MNELLRVIQAIPRPLRFLASFLMLVPLVIAVAMWMHLDKRTTMFLCLGVLALMLLVGGVSALARAGDKRRSKEFEGNLGVHARQGGVGKQEIREALAELAQKWQLAVRQLREAGLSIYSLPWYLLIGEPQSGKSTTLKNSGLEFPVGSDGLSGAGGTRNCDWWFSNEAVILDTAGRFTFQEESAPDSHEWTAFLKLLKRHRKQCPINGVIIVIPATSLVEDAPDEQERKAKNIRAKLLHLQKLLEIRFPVYVLVTKADRILGFTEFFTKLDPADQRQLFGWSNPNPPEEPWDPKGFGAVFENIVTRVHKVRLRLMNEEGSLSQIDKMFVFPEELAALQEPLFAYLHTMFATSRYEEHFILRGFYITSGVQQGRPIARACRDLLRVSAGDPQGVLEDLEQVFRKARAFFIRDFYEKKAFQEQGLVARTRAAFQKDRVNRWVVNGLIGLIVALLLFSGACAYPKLHGDLRAIKLDVEKAQGCLAGTEKCDLVKSWELVDRLEQHRKRLLERNWFVRALLPFVTGKVTTTYLPAIQGQLLKNGVLPPLLASFDARGREVAWADHFEAYGESFFPGLQTLLRIQEHRTGVDPARKPGLRAEMKVEALVSFCRRTKGLDKTDRGRQVDAWVAGLNASSARLEAVFKNAWTAKPEMASVGTPQPDGSIRAFREYWTARNLGRWEPTLYFSEYSRLQGQILQLGSQSSTALLPFSRGTQELAENFELGARIMKGERPESVARRPGLTVAEWETNCNEDQAVLAAISAGQLGDVARCATIPAQWQQLVGRREDYQHLYVETPRQAAGVTWSENAGKLKSAWFDLGKLAAPDEIARAISNLNKGLEGQGSSTARLGVVESYRKEQEGLLRGPETAVSGWDSPGLASAFRAGETVRTTRELAALTLATRTATPLGVFFSDVFRSCTDCSTSRYAKDNVPPANSFVNWAKGSFLAIRGNEDVERAIDDVNRALHDYLSRMVGRPSGPSGPTLSFPDRAMKAARWSELVREIASWRVVLDGAAPSASGALTADEIQEYARENDYLKGLVRSASGGRRGAPTGPPQELVSAAESFKRCVSGLDDRALAAWLQLAGDPKLREEFHALTSKSLRSQPGAGQWRGLEEAAAGLLVREIRPDYERASKKLWDRVNRWDRFPFISGQDLERLRRLYAQGPQLGAGNELWGPVTRDIPRRESSVTLSFETASEKDLEDLLYRDGTFDDLFADFALEPIVAGEEKAIDFVGSDKQRLRTMRRWQRFLYPVEERRGRDAKPEVEIRLLERVRGGAQARLGERVGLLDFFGGNRIRPSNPAVATPAVPLLFEERPLLVSGVNEDRNGWTGRLELKGGPLKLVYFVLIAAEGRPSRDGTKWTVRLELPDFEQPSLRPEGLFEFSFDRPLPDVFEESGGDG